MPDDTCPCCLGRNGRHYPQLCPVDWEERFRELMEATLREAGIEESTAVGIADSFVSRLHAITKR